MMRPTYAAWLRLDNAANLYPAIETKGRTHLYNVSAVLRDEVDPELLQEAVGHIMPRFPYFSVTLKRGLFWYYFDQLDHPPTVQQEEQFPCPRFSGKRDGGHLLRIVYQGRRVGVDFFHALTDANGALVFLYTLLLSYFRLCGHTIPESNLVTEPLSAVEGEELEDSYAALYVKEKLATAKKRRAFHISGPLTPPGVMHAITAAVPVKDMKQLTRPLGVTITEYFTALFIYTLYSIQQEKSLQRLPVRLSVPVDLRNLFPSKTMRNFALFVRPEISPALGTYTFEEILKHVHHSLQFEVQKKHLASAVSANVALQRHPAVKILPLGIKRLIMSFVFTVYGENLHSGALSNLGLVHLPEEMEQLITAMDFTLGPNRINPENCAVIGYREALYVTFSRSLEHPEVSRRFFTHLTARGIEVSITRSV